MRRTGLLIGATCLAACAAPHPSPTTQPDPVVRGFVDGAMLVVRGVARSSDHGRTGTINIQSIYKGACPPGIAFVAEPFEVVDDEAIFFLHPDAAGRWQIAPTGPGYGGLSAFEEPRVIDAIHGAPTIANAETADLAAFREAHGKPWSPAQTPVLAVAERIFDHVAWIGATEDDLTRALGAPDEVTPEHAWTYKRHNGEQGVIRRLRIANKHVIAVDLELTQ